MRRAFLNHLAHFALAGEDPELVVGNFLGDYVKGRLDDQYPPGIIRGIRLHRAVDSFTDQHAIVKQGHKRFSDSFRRYAGIMTDVYFDYLLARHWHNFYAVPLEDFSRRTLSMLLADGGLPAKAEQTATRMQQHNSLAGYGNSAFVRNAFTHISGRLKRVNPLLNAFEQCSLHHDGLLSDLEAFYPCLMEYCDDWKQNH